MTATTTGLSNRQVTYATTLLVVHLVVTVGHSIAHVGASVFLPPGLTAVIQLVFLLGPIAGVVLLRRGRERLGAAVFTASMVVALAFGFAFHFVLDTPDHVAAVPAGPWQLPFRLTAVAFFPVDAAGALLGGWLVATAGADTRTDDLDTGRIDGVPDAGLRPFTRLSYWGARRWVGELPASLTVTAHSRAILVGTNAFELALDRATAVDDRLTELAVLKAAMAVGCAFCIDIGSAQARDLGVTEAQLRALRDDVDSDVFSERERLVLRYAEAMSATPSRVSDELFAALEREFDEAQLVELTAAIAFENYRARFNAAFDLDAQGFSAGEFCPLPAEGGERRAVSAEAG